MIILTIGDIDSPFSIKSAEHVKINDIDNCAETINGILKYIYGEHLEKILSTQLSFDALENITGLSDIDNFTLKNICDYAILNNKLNLNAMDIMLQKNTAQIPEIIIAESLSKLTNSGFIENADNSDNSIRIITSKGWEVFFNTYLENYQQIKNNIVSLIVNNEVVSNYQIKDRLKQSILIIDHILNSLMADKYLRLSRLGGSTNRIYDVSPSLEQLLE